MKYNYKLTRENDNKVLRGTIVKYVEWNENDRGFKELYDEPSIGRSIILDPHRMSFTWLTTVITSFSEENGILKFKTRNSNYILEKNSNEI